MNLIKPRIVSDGTEVAVLAPWLVHPNGKPGYITAKASSPEGIGLARLYRDPAKGSVDTFAVKDYLSFIAAAVVMGEAYRAGLAN